jgi:hypothetical protein
MNRTLVTLSTALLMAAQPATGQPPAQELKNLQYFPKDIPRPKLVQRMREFSFSLGVRCQHCHAGGDGVSMEGVDFASDEKAAKKKARAMLKMTDQINGTLLAQVPSRTEPTVVVDCVTCHRGLPLPKTLQTTLFEIVGKDGAPAAVARYRELRKDQMPAGKYNFGEWEINELARRLNEKGDTTSAVAILEMNAEFYPQSGAIDYMLGEIHRARGEKEKAIARYEAAMAKSPGNPQPKQRLEELRKTP